MEDGRMKQILALLTVNVVRQTIMVIVLVLLVVYSLYSSRNCLGSQVTKAVRPVIDMTSDESTIFLLAADRNKNALVDRTGRFTPSVSGATIVDDAQVGPCIRFGSRIGNVIAVEDGGRIAFDGGFTLEAWVYFEDIVTSGPGGVLASKPGSFSLSLKDSKLNNAWMVFPKEKVFTDTAKQFKAYPVDNQTFYGYMPIPSKRWVHLAITYDQTMKVIRTWIDGGIDRTHYVSLDGDAPVLSDPAKSIEFVKGMKNVRVASIKLSKGALPMGTIPAMEAYVHQLPYESKIAVSFDHINRELSLPIDVTLILESPGGLSKVVKNISLDSAERKDVLIDAPSWKGALHTLTVKAYSRNQLVFSRAVRVSNTDPGKRIRVNKDKTLTVDGKKIFPILIYHAFPEDYGLLADMGFNIIIPRGLGLKLMGTGGRDGKTMSDLKTCLDEAFKRNVYLIVEGNTVFGNLNRIPQFTDHPALLAWSGFDEPWGTLDRFQESYNIVKLLDPDRPIYGTQNNTSRFAQTAEGADIIAPDSYPVPKTSLRDVVFRTSAASRAVAGLKPVWTILGQYENSRPNLQELRCMAYLAIISGANGIGMYAWDDRKGKKTGWYTKEHPEDEKVLRSVIQELRSLEKILLIPNSERKTSFSPRTSALHAAVKETAGKKYLFIASDSRREEEGILSVEGITDAVGISLSPETVGSTVRIKEGKLSLKFPPLDAVLYEIQ